MASTHGLADKTTRGIKPPNNNKAMSRVVLRQLMA
jgi:hypothetical protein